VAAWIWTRTAGPPFGPEAGVRHAAALVDITCVVFEAAIVVVACLLLVRPALGTKLSGAWRGPALVIGLYVVIMATAAIASPSAAEHVHDETAAAHQHGEATNAASGAVTSDAVASSHDGAHTHSSASDSTTPTDDKGLSLLENGEMSHHYGADEPLDATTRAALVHQLALTRLIADTYPTLKDAKAAGSQAAGAYGPGLGIHMSMPPAGVPLPRGFDPTMVAGGSMSDGAILRPGSLMYAGTDDDSPLAGFMYNAMTPGEPDGFAGPNDHWHKHSDLCIHIAGGRITTIQGVEKTQQACGAAGGQLVSQTNYMVHVWTVPGYESNRGVFSDINPSLTCSDGTYHVVPKAITDNYQTNKCAADAA
jgi:hypothetical protein